MRTSIKSRAAVAMGVVASAALVAMGTAMAPSAVATPPDEGLPEFYTGRARTGTPGQVGFATGTAFITSAALGGQMQSLVAKTNVLTGEYLGAVQSMSINRKTVTADGRTQSPFNTQNYVYFDSPPGAEHPYGDLPDLVVDTLAFGMIPVRATVKVSQLRDDFDLPVPLTARAYQDSTSPVPIPAHDADLRGELLVEVADVVIDGVQVTFAGQCRSSRPGKVEMIGNYPASGYTPAEGEYHPIAGGKLYGTIDLPPMTGCVTDRGEDISRVITAAVSQEGNPLMATQGVLGQSIPCDPAVLCRLPARLPHPGKMPAMPTTPPQPWTPDPIVKDEPGFPAPPGPTPVPVADAFNFD